MKVIDNEKHIMFDVDDTLVMWHFDDMDSAVIEVTDPNDNNVCRVKPHKFHVDLLKKHKGRGYHVTVWSAGGWAWAEAVVKELGISEYVDVVMSKPIKYVDDLPAREILGQYMYFAEKVDG